MYIPYEHKESLIMFDLLYFKKPEQTFHPSSLLANKNNFSHGFPIDGLSNSKVFVYDLSKL